MSWEAVTWASKQKLKKTYEQCVLLVLANCADPNGEAFVKWPGRDHWWIYLSEKTRLPKSSLFRHLNTLVALGLGERSMQVLADGSRRPTFKLNMAAAFDIELPEDQERYQAAFAKGSHENQSPVGTEHDDGFEGAENDSDISHSQDMETELAPQSPVGTGSEPAQSPVGTEPFPVLRLQKDSLLVPKDSPLPPSGGVHPADQGFEEFRKAWAWPMERPSIAKTVWDKVPTAKHGEVIAAAKGYAVHTDMLLARGKKDPAIVSAQTFLRESSGWAQWLRYTPASDGKPQLTADPSFAIDSAEGKAIRALYAVARTHPQELQNRVRYPGEITPLVLAFAGPDMIERSRWLWIEDRNQIGSWSEFLKRHVFTNRPELVVTRGMGANERRGIYAPWAWPPRIRKDGTLSTTGPPEGSLMSEEDFSELK